MRITFVSNYINHHQIPFSNACYRELEGAYFFIQTEPMEEERTVMGWGDMTGQLPYVRSWAQEEDVCRKLILESEITIFGWSEKEEIMDQLIHQRLKAGRPVLRVSERLYREGQWRAVSPKGLIRKYFQHTRYRKQPAYLLCAGAYVASDFRLIRSYPEKMYRFGYFPETMHYTWEQLQERKGRNRGLQLVWAGRMIPLKHPEFALGIARELKALGKEFHLHMAGGGEMEAQLRKEAEDVGLEAEVTFYGYTGPARVREIMEEGHIFLFTSNQLEGWGAVVNEAMNSGCAVVAGSQAGAVPYLIRHGVNGLVYEQGRYASFAALVKDLAGRPEQIEALGRAACRTITEQWNAEEAARRVIAFGRKLLQGKAEAEKEGPMSPAPLIPPPERRKRKVR